MKNLLYIGNKLSQKGKTVTTIDTLSSLLIAESFKVKSVSNKKNKWLRLGDMLLAIIKNAKWANYVLIDTYSTQNFYFAYFTSQLCRGLGLKYLPILHGGNLPNRLENSPKLSSSIFKNAFQNIAPSTYTLNAFVNKGFQNTIIIPNSISLENYPFKNRKIEKVKLLWVRSFSKLYNPKLAVDVLNQLQKHNIESELCMVGPNNDGSLESTKTYAKSLNLNVKFTGRLSKKDWINLSENYNIFINTTNFDNMPVSVIEAMALGLPVVSTNVGGLPFLIKNEIDGFLVAPNNVHAFVEVIKHLKNKEAIQSKIIINARKKAETYNWESVKQLWKGTLV